MLTDLLDVPLIQIFGPQSSGKSTLLGWFALEHAKRGDRTILINPLAKAGDLKWVEVRLSPDAGIQEFVAELNRRLQNPGAIATEMHWCLLCDEVDVWQVDQSIKTDLLKVQQLLSIVNMSVRQVGYQKSNVMKHSSQPLWCCESATSFHKIQTMPGRHRQPVEKAWLYVPGRSDARPIELP